MKKLNRPRSVRVVLPTSFTYSLKQRIMSKNSCQSGPCCTVSQIVVSGGHVLTNPSRGSQRIETHDPKSSNHNAEIYQKPLHAVYDT
jgi:hypothetical protein